MAVPVTDTQGVLQVKSNSSLAPNVGAIFNGIPKTIVDGSATPLFDVSIPDNMMVGGIIFYNVRATDGTDYQSMAGMVSYSAVSKAGTITLVITNATAND